MPKSQRGNSAKRQEAVGAQTEAGSLETEAQKFVQELAGKLAGLEIKNPRPLCEMMMETWDKRDVSVANERAEPHSRKAAAPRRPQRKLGTRTKH